jgi:hypothetical protein
MAIARIGAVLSDVMQMIAHDQQIVDATAVSVESVIMQVSDLESLDSDVSHIRPEVPPLQALTVSSVQDSSPLPLGAKGDPGTRSAALLNRDYAGRASVNAGPDDDRVTRTDQMCRALDRAQGRY